jgi:hypothetical protein
MPSASMATAATLIHLARHKVRRPYRKSCANRSIPVHPDISRISSSTRATLPKARRAA